MPVYCPALIDFSIALKTKTPSMKTPANTNRSQNLWLKLKTLLALAVCLGLPVATEVRAATIQWGAATTISADSDVSTAGTFLGAYSLNAGGDTINGVVFASATSGATCGTNFIFSTPLDCSTPATAS